MAIKKIPKRLCIGCQEMFPKKELIRIVKTPADEILVDKTGKQSGRGAYICAKESCFKEIEKNKRLEKAFKRQISAEVYAELLEHLNK